MKQIVTMKEYILETPDAALKNIEQYTTLVESLCSYTKETNTLWLVASGSSYNACMMAKPFMEENLTCIIHVTTPYTFIHYTKTIQDKDTVIVISQSGYSTNAIEAVHYANVCNLNPIVLTGNVHSDIVNYANIVIDYGVGEELVGYVTKGVTLLALFLILFAIKKSDSIKYIDTLKKAIALHQEVIDKTTSFIQNHYKDFTSMHQCYLLGAGYTTGVCLEGALKIGELVHIPTNYFEIEEYIHGPNFQLTPNYTVLFFDSNDATSQRVQRIYEATKAVTNRTFIITANTKYQEDDHALIISDIIDSRLLSIVYLPFVQLVSFIVSKDTHVIKQHPLMKQFIEFVDSKTNNYKNYDEDV